MIRGFANMTYEEKLEELYLFSLETRSLSRDTITVFRYTMGAHQVLHVC